MGTRGSTTRPCSAAQFVAFPLNTVSAEQQVEVAGGDSPGVLGAAWLTMVGTMPAES